VPLFLIPPAEAAAVHKLRPSRVWLAGPSPRRPWIVRIPSIGVNAQTIALGGPTGASLPVPPLSAAQQIGWYNFSAFPGQRGNMVLAGHVDTYQGAAVFYNLYLLRPGDKIYIRVGSHGPVRYTVRSIRELPKTRFPARQIFGDTDARRLWLITCGGAFSYAAHHYLDNIIVSASQ
jgi:LPXTG-site transpeptidase (sortase) family protein